MIHLKNKILKCLKIIKEFFIFLTYFSIKQWKIEEISIKEWQRNIFL
jgi:hypothetical protein